MLLSSPIPRENDGHFQLFYYVLNILQWWMWSSSIMQTVKKKIFIFYSCCFKQSGCEIRAVIRMNDDINKVAFNLKSLCFSYRIRGQRSYLELFPSSVTAEHKFKQRGSVEPSRWGLFPHFTSTLFAAVCAFGSQTITLSLLVRFHQTVAAHVSDWFIYSCKSYFKWLTSKLFVYCAKWRAASPSDGAADWMSALCKLAVQSKHVFVLRPAGF